MYKILLILIVVVLLSCKNENHKSNYLSFIDYKEDFKIINSLKPELDCEIINATFNEIKTIDGKERLVDLYGDKCNLNFDFQTKNNSDLYNKLHDLLEKDQHVRQEFNYVMDSLNLNFSENKDISELLMTRKHYWDSIVKKTDSINLLKFSIMIDSVGEWIGAEYFKRKHDTPKIGILVGHFPEEYYRKYTEMAYQSAIEGKEYWSRIILLIGFSKKYPIEDMEYFMDKKKIVPFRFTEYSKNEIIEDSGLSILEFSSLANSQITFGNQQKASYKLTSSIETLESRKNLLEQAKRILIKYGWDENLIILDYNQEKYEDYKLYYQIVK